LSCHARRVATVHPLMASKLAALSEIPLGSAAVAKMSAEELEEALEHFYRLKAAAEAGIVEVLGEVQRRESFRRDGATSSEKWQVE
jgi:Asp-tRNA(Asn)/Glu-tRNA(Gln) amidotransferase C subunit